MSQSPQGSLAVQILPAGPADAEALASVHVTSWRETYRELLPEAFLARMSEPGYVRRFRRELTEPRPNEVTLIALTRDGVVGYVSGGPSRSRAPEGEAEIATLYLLRRAQGRGIGRRLLGAAVRALAAEGASSLKISVLRDNLPARGFYERLGGVAGVAHEEPGPGGRNWEVTYRWESLGRLLR